MRLKFFPWLGASSLGELVSPRRRYRDDLDLVYEAVRQNGLAIKYASKRLLLGEISHTIGEIHVKQWKEREVSELPLILDSIRNLNVLRQQHHTIVFSAVDQTAAALQFAAPHLLQDHSLLRRLAEVNGMVLEYAPWQCEGFHVSARL